MFSISLMWLDGILFPDLKYWFWMSGSWRSIWLVIAEWHIKSMIWNQVCILHISWELYRSYLIHAQFYAAALSLT